jgi:hypothetical protein
VFGGDVNRALSIAAPISFTSEFLRLDYPKLSALLEDAPSLTAAINLNRVLHFSTFQKATAGCLFRAACNGCWTGRCAPQRRRAS